MNRRQQSADRRESAGDEDELEYAVPARRAVAPVAKLRSGVVSLAAVTSNALTSPLKWRPTKYNKRGDADISLDDSSEDSYIFDDEQENYDDTRDDDGSIAIVGAPPRRIARRSARTPSRRQNSSQEIISAVQPTGGFIDPWEVPAQDAEGNQANRNVAEESSMFIDPTATNSNIISQEQDITRLRLFAGQLSADWRGQDFMAPALARRIRDFQFAQEKRRQKYGDERPWGILGLYDFLAGIRIDVEWAEDAAWRRASGEPYLSWADFDASKTKGMNRPWFVYLILFVCTVALVASFALNGWVIEPLDINPMIGPSAQTLIRMGAKDSDLIVNYNESWRLVSSIILHAGLVHYIINMLALWFVGGAIEKSHGSVAAAILFIIPAIGGTILSALFLPEYITVGASGGIFGLIGACVADITMNWKLLFNDFVTENGKKHHHMMVIIFIILDILLNCIIGLTPFVDNFTHLGGMGIGFLSGLSTMERLSVDFFGVKEGCLLKTKQIIVRFFGLIVSIIGMVIALIVLLEGDGQTTPCPDCTWLSCVPFPPWKGRTDKWWYCDDCDLVRADIVQTPMLHLELECPDGTSVSVELNGQNDINHDELISKLPSYCREFCPEVNARF